MVAISHTLAAVAASLFTMAAAETQLSWTSVITAIPSPTVTKPASAMTTMGCFETGTPLQNYGSYDFQSPGNCQLICLQLDKDVLALSDGENCWCGDLMPAKDWQTSNSSCSTTCSGDDTSMCGGKNKLWVILSGNTRNEVDYYEPPASSSSSSAAATATSTTAAKTSAAASTSTSAADTPSATASSKPKESGPNTTAIAVGVVVGIVGLAAIIGGVLFFMRRRRQRQAEENYRRNAANVDAFVAGGKLHTSNSSMNDSRLDPIFVDRRQSNGSIADNEDYSRRILKVTNV